MGNTAQYNLITNHSHNYPEEYCKSPHKTPKNV